MSEIKELIENVACMARSGNPRAIKDEYNAKIVDLIAHKTLPEDVKEFLVNVSLITPTRDDRTAENRAWRLAVKYKLYDESDEISCEEIQAKEKFFGC